MKTSVKVLVALVLSIATVSTALAKDYDLVINNGRVMDPETNYDQVADVGITDGKIAVITTKKIKGKETIDAKGLVVAPGFLRSVVDKVKPPTDAPIPGPRSRPWNRWLRRILQ